MFLAYSVDTHPQRGGIGSTAKADQGRGVGFGSGAGDSGARRRGKTQIIAALGRQLAILQGGKQEN